MKVLFLRLAIFFCLILNQSYLFSQNIEELQFIGTERIEHHDLGINDHLGNFVTNITFSKTEDTGKYKTDFVLYGNKLSIDRFNYSIVNKEANRLYTFGPKLFLGDHVNINYLHIYDLNGESIFSDFENVIIGKDIGFAVSDNGDVVIAGNELDGKCVILKFSKEGNLVWKSDLPKNVPIRDLEIAPNGSIAVLQNPHLGPRGKGKITILKSLSGEVLNEILSPSTNKLVFFDGKELLFGFRSFISHYSSLNENLDLKAYSLFQDLNSYLFASYLTVASNGQYFSGIAQDFDTPQQHLFLYQKVNGIFILKKKLNLSEFKKRNNLTFSVKNISINEGGEVNLDCYETIIRFK
jgi:hypothetical protein